MSRSRFLTSLSLLAGFAVAPGCANAPGVRDGSVVVGRDVGTIMVDAGSNEVPDPSSVGQEAPASMRQNAAVRRAIYLGNLVGSDVFEAALNRVLTTEAPGASYAETPMTHLAARMGTATRAAGDGGTGRAADPTVPANAATSRCAFADLPLEVGESIACRPLVQRAIGEAATALSAALDAAPLAASTLNGATDVADVQNWYRTAAEFAVSSSMPVALTALRAVGVCDDRPTSADAAFERGILLGRELYRQRLALALQNVAGTLCEANPVSAMVLPPPYTADADTGRIIDQLLRDAPALCSSFSGNTAETQRLANAAGQRRAGVAAGIDEQRAVSENELVRTRPCYLFSETGLEGLGGFIGDPLVVDVDGDGVSIAPLAYGAQFDFGAGRRATEWALGDPLLVRDDGDGVIEVGELFGDRHVDHADSFAADGLAALARYDLAASAGNGDGRIDAADAVFASLALWHDDGDGRSTPEELEPLAVRVRAITLDGDVTMASGQHVHAVDLWFQAR